jgi:hypothetical protein
LVTGPIEYDDDTIKITSLFNRTSIHSWSDLEYYGNGEAGYLIQFGDASGIQIYPTSYAPEDWSKLIDYLQTRFPNRKADGWVNDRLFRWPWKEKD